ncbi:MAG: DALR anticodon-binding domain-containing protein, partial [Bacteroidota bacterium]
HLEFDIDLAKEQSEKNPVYYVQYAHARIASILRFAESEGVIQSADASGLQGVEFGLLKEASEVALAKLLLEFPGIVESACMGFEPQRLTTYLHDVATGFHKFYHDHRVVIPERELSRARLGLCLASKMVLANGCTILGITAPESM